MCSCQRTQVAPLGTRRQIKEATGYAHQRCTGIEKPKARAKGLYGDETEEKEKPKLNLTVREEQRNKLEQMASIRSVPSPILSRLWPMNVGSD